MPVIIAYICVILIWSTTPLAIKWSGDGAGYLFGVSSRMLIGTLVVLMLFAFTRHRLIWDSSAWKSYLSATIGIYGAMMCVYWGAQYIPSGMIAVLFGLTPITTGVLAAMILGERSLAPHKLAGIALAIGGLVVVFHEELIFTEQSKPGLIAILVATVLHSLSTVLVKCTATKLPVMVINGGSLLVSSILFAFTWLVVDGKVPSGLPVHSWGSIIYLGVFGSVIGFSLYYYTLKNLSANTIGMIPLITPVLALLLGELFNGEQTTPMIWGGTLIISLGLMVHQWGGSLRLHTCRKQAVLPVDNSL